MSTPRAAGYAKKRGHQHHPRNDGNRRRLALEVSTSPKLSAYSTNNAVTVQKSTITNENNVIRNSASPQSCSKEAENKPQFQKESKVKNCDIEVIDLTNCDDEIITTSSCKQEPKQLEDVCEKCSKTVKEDRNRKIRKPRKSKSTIVEEIKQDMSLVQRPEAEGSSLSDQETENDVTLDPELEELSKLRCTSEMTEVVAEREKRRNRRCADYPGLAFSSIFSSDTLMKFSIIKNELHNIMNTQLKRVGNFSECIS
ncbi:hypothetical protein JTB14_026497 [Gonioctena quinquepunctata]|nr:hypothetical protein JTB14_026497 [Gonioctena quinquepunctata]